MQSSPELILRQSVARHEADSILPAAARFPLDLAAVRHHLRTDPGRSKALLLQALRRVSSDTYIVCIRVSLVGSLPNIANTSRAAPKSLRSPGSLWDFMAPCTSWVTSLPYGRNMAYALDAPLSPNK